MHLALMLLALVPSLPAAPAAPAPANLLKNPGFEGGVTADGLPAGGWYRNYGDANSKWVLQTGGAHSGMHCMRLEAPTIPQHNPSVTLEQAVPVVPGRRYALRLWTRGEPTGAEGQIYIVWLKKDHGWITATGGSFRFGPKWEEQRIDGTAPEGAGLGVARIDIRQPGTAWVDDEFMAEVKPVSLSANFRSGVITAGATFRLKVRPLDFDGVAVPSTPVSCAIATLDDAAVLAPGPSRSASVQTDDAGAATFSIRASSRPGFTDTIALTAGAAHLRLAITSAAHGIPKSFSVTPDARTGAPGAQVPVHIQLLGLYGEPVPLSGRKASLTLDGSGSLSSPTITTDRHGAATVRVRLARDLYSRAAVSVADSAGIKGKSASVIVAPPVRADQVHLGPNGYFLNSDGTVFLPLGGLYGNWVHKVVNGVRGATISPSIAKVSDAQLRAQFAYLRDNGVTAVRVMLRDHTAKGTEPMDAIGKVNMHLLREWEHYMKLARPYGLRFLVTLHESWYATYAAYFNAGVMERCVLPQYTPAELKALPPYRSRFLVDKRMLSGFTDALTDPDVLACQRDYLTDLIPRLRGNPAIFAYEIENEQPAGFFTWTEDQIRLIRQLDPTTPICVSNLGGGILHCDILPWSTRTTIDFDTPHPYPGGNTTPQMDYGTEIAVVARYGRLGKPCFTGESMGDQWFKATPAAQHLGARDDIWGQLCAGAPGCFFWDTSDAAIKEFRLAHEVMSRLDLAHFRRARPRVGISVAHPMKNDTFFDTPEGRPMYDEMGKIARACFRRGVDFDFALDNSSYPVRLKVTDAAKVASLKPEVAIPKGWEAQYLLSADGKTFVCYLRNVGGPAQITSNPADGWTRMRKPARLTISLNLPLRSRKLTLVDFDTGKARSVDLSHALDLGTTDHDYLLTTAALP